MTRLRNITVKEFISFIKQYLKKENVKVNEEEIEKEVTKTISSDVVTISRGQKITGDNITFIVPDDMNNIKVRILAKNGTFLNEYTISNFISIDPGQRLQILVD